MLLATAVTVTNLVGSVLTGEFVGCTPRTLTVTRPGGVRTEIPLTALSPDCRERMMALGGCLPERPEVKRIRARLESEARRIERMRATGWLTPEAADAQLAAERRNAELRLRELEKQRGR